MSDVLTVRLNSHSVIIDINSIGRPIFNVSIAFFEKKSIKNRDKSLLKVKKKDQIVFHQIEFYMKYLKFFYCFYLSVSLILG